MAPRSFPVALVLFAALGAGGCEGSSGPAPTPASIRIEPASLTVDEGATVQARATVLDQNGQPIAQPSATAPLTWSVSNATVARVTGDGQVTGLLPGTAQLVAAAGDARASASVTVRGVPASITLVSGGDQTALAGSALDGDIVARVVNRQGNSVAGREIRFRVVAGGGSVTPAAATSDADGMARARWTLGPQPGEQRVEAAVADAAALVASVRASAISPEDVPAIVSISADTIRAGQTITLRGRNFASSAASVQVTIGGATAAVTAATAGELTVAVPSARVLGCRAAGPVAVVVRVAGLASPAFSHPLRVAQTRTLSPGQLLRLAGAEAECVELAGAAGEYMVGVYNVSQAASLVAPFRLQGTARAAAAAPQPSRAPGAAAPSRIASEVRAARAREQAAHLRGLERGAADARLLAARRTPRVARPSFSRDAAASASVGDTLQLRVPRLAEESLCANPVNVRARVVHVGERGIVLEDVQNPLAGTMDADYAAIGAEFDRDMYPLIRQNFGDPLALDDMTDANGRLLMLFTRAVNETPNVLGFVWPGDLFEPDAGCPTPNTAEIFYGKVPTSATGTGASSRAEWLRRMRGVVMHEVKHITSFVERLEPLFRRNESFVLEDTWLEEATAMAAEEVWARGVFGYAAGANVGFRQSLFCEIFANQAECAGKPYSMTEHFLFLGDYLSEADALSPIYDRDVSFYGSGWALLRWAVDHSGTAEAEFLRALTAGRDRGVANLSARAGRGFGEMIADWSLALALDDRPGFTPQRPELSFRSWNLHDIYAGLAEFDLWPRPMPLRVRDLAAGPISHSGQVRAGSSAYFRLAGSAGGAQAVGLSGEPDGEPDGSLRMQIVRVR